ncbi:hypothetical protein [Seonamhaeicola marinus]|uniref:DUF1330 domain-containing protein n=1 Tax=Seonamhaeicola marinus TaxID=1912246 RepID=A0A5D0HTB0_9FLAO|nr:hypothetical protein [Seonamhaeicola marinus]TYA74535.1 hypothetical protein FUA24_14540 [Seonamhaeicola marinus]
MHQLKSITLSLFIFFALSMKGQNAMVKSHQMNTMEKTKPTKQHQISLKKGDLFLVISSITKPDAQKAMNAYFQKVFPIASKYGFKPLANLPIDNIVAGSYKPNNFFGLYTWPNKEAAASFLKELPNSELKPMRLKIWDELKQSAIIIDQETTLTFSNEKVYEITMLYNKKKLKEKKINKHHGKVLFSKPVSGYEDLTSGSAPDYLAIIEWNSEEEARAYKYHAHGALDNEETFYTHIQISEDK